MKVMFLFQGLPHYYNYVLNKLDKTDDIEIIDVIPKDISTLVGEGIYNTREDVEFKIYELEEYDFRPSGFFFKSFWKLVLKERPKIIITTEQHLLGFIYNLPTFLILKLMNIKLILKTHPFCIYKYNELRKKLKDELIKTRGKPSLGLSNILMTIKYYDKVINLWFKRFYYNFPDALVCYVEEAYQVFASYGVNSNKIFITRNAPDTDRLFDIYDKLSKECIKVKPHRIIHIGRLIEWKRVDLLLLTVAELKKRYPDIELIVVGDGPKMSEWKNLSNTLGIQDSVQFTGGIYNPADLGRYLMSSSIYVLAGMGGLSISEAMCFGLPVICSVCDGTEKYLVKEGLNGLFFKEGDRNDLYKKIEYLFENPDLCAKMGSKSIDIIKKDINIHTVIDGYIRAFKYSTCSQSPVKYILK